MSAMRCKFEGEMIRAQRSGAWTSSLLHHKEECADCCEALRVAEVFRADAAALEAAPPPAMQLLAAVERRQSMAALDRAAQVFQVLKFAGILYAVIFIAWGLHALSVHAGDSVLPGLTAKSLGASIKGTAFAAVFVLSGIWYAVRRDRPQMISSR
jgi:hypothetical protein